MNSILFALMLLALQQGTITGWVRAEGSLEPVPFASVEIEGHRSVLADEHGYFVAPGVPAGPATVRVSMIGYGAVDTTVVVTEGETVRLELLLPQRPVALEGIRATADRATTDAAATPGPPPIRVDAPTLDLVPAMAEKDAFRALQMLPAVAAASDFSSALYIRGGSPDQTVVLLDGAPLFNPYHLGGLFSAIDPDAISTMEVLPGGMPATDGDRASGIVKVWTRDGGRDRLRGHGAIGLVSSRLGFDGPLPGGDGSYLVSARRTYFDAMTHLAHELGALETPFPYSFTDVHAKITHDVGSTGRLNVSGYINDERVHTPSEVEDDERTAFEWGTRAGSVAYRQPLGPFLGEVTLAATSFDGAFEAIDFQATMPADTFFLGRITMRDLLADASLTWYGAGHEVKAGIQIDTYDFQYDFSLGADGESGGGDGVDDLFSELREARGITTLAAYLEDDWSISPDLALRLGVRALDAPGLPTQLMPRAGLRWSFAPDLAFTAAVGRYAQAIHSLRDEESILASVVPYELLVPASAEAGYLVAEDITAGVEYSVPDTRLRVDAYYKRYPSLPTPPLSDDPMSAPIFATEFLPGTGWATGLEVFAQHRTGDVTLMGSYALTAAERATEDVEYTPRYNRAHMLDVTAGYDIGETGMVSARLAAGTGQPYTPALGHLVGFLWEPQMGVQPVGDDIVLGAHNSERLPSYLRLDMAARKELTRTWFGREFTITPYLQVLNVLGTRNVTSGQPQDSYGGQAELEYLPALPVLPTFGVEWSF